MRTKLRLWWQQIKKRRVTILIVAIILVIVIVLIIIGYKFDWTGFNGNSKSGKTLWDWMQLLIIPLALAIIALVFQLANTRTERQIAKERYEQDQQIALEKQQGDLLQAYLDRMSELLLKESLLPSPTEAVRNVAQVRTAIVLCQLDGKRVGYVFSFLREAGLMSTQSNASIISLRNVGLIKVNWSQADLSGATLREAILSEANLSGATLREVNLSGANLSGANLHGADLSYANLSGAILRGAILRRADLSYANLSGAIFSSMTYVPRALGGTLLVIPNRADLSGADLSQSNLKDAKGITIDELEKQAKSLKGATMPDGKIHS